MIGSDSDLIIAGGVQYSRGFKNQSTSTRSSLCFLFFNILVEAYLIKHVVKEFSATVHDAMDRTHARSVRGASPYKHERPNHLS